MGILVGLKIVVNTSLNLVFTWNFVLQSFHHKNTILRKKLFQIN